MELGLELRGQWELSDVFVTRVTTKHVNRNQWPVPILFL